MFSNYHKEACGRYTPKPENKFEDEVELFEEAEPIQQKIDNLRTKIMLQERYNAALKDSMEETSTGTFAMLRGIASDIYNLRVNLREAINKEKWAVNNALRTHRDFQLALKGCTPGEAIDWIDDKLFDNAKILNDHLDRLIIKRKRLESTEVAVTMLEKWPIPGSLPWEIEMDDKMRDVLVSQSNIAMKLECAKTLSEKYKAIRGRVRDERDWYQPILRNLSSQLSFQLNELRNLEQMLGYAQKFSKGAAETLEMTEKEVSFNRKVRRAQITKMRREMQRMVLEEQSALQGKVERRQSEIRHDSIRHSDNKHRQENGFLHTQTSSSLLVDNQEALMNNRLAQKRAIIDTFNDNSAMLVNVMKIPNLTHIPQRMQNVINLTKILKEEKKSKEILKSNLIRQRDQLMQLFCVIRYTGSDHVEQNNLIIQDYQKALEGLKKKCSILQEALNQDSSMVMDIQMGVASLITRIDGLDHKTVNIRNSEHLMQMLPVFYEKLDALTRSYLQLKQEFPSQLEMTPQTKRQALHRMAALIQKVPGKFVRAGEPLDIEEASEEEEFEDFKVPGRVELKLKSEKFVEQALLRLGFTDGANKQRSRQNSILETSRPGSLD